MFQSKLIFFSITTKWHVLCLRSCWWFAAPGQSQRNPVHQHWFNQFSFDYSQYCLRIHGCVWHVQSQGSCAGKFLFCSFLIPFLFFVFSFSFAFFFFFFVFFFFVIIPFLNLLICQTIIASRQNTLLDERYCCCASPRRFGARRSCQASRRASSHTQPATKLAHIGNSNAFRSHNGRNACVALCAHMASG